MNNCSNHGDAKTNHSSHYTMLRYAALDMKAEAKEHSCLFLKIRKSKFSFTQVLESHIACVKVFLWHIQRFSYT